MNRLQTLYAKSGQSPWLDNLRRGWITSGELSDWVDKGVRGITSNPTIFQKAMTDTDVYDGQLAKLSQHGSSTLESYWTLAVSDIVNALDILRPVYDASNGQDGFVSVEVDPGLAADTEGTILAARTLHERINRPNLYVKIPATSAGLPAITQMIAEGRSINVTLIFSVNRYLEVMDAYLRGLEANEGDLSGISSVASFFISRTDTEVDRRLEALGTSQALELRGLAAIAQARVAYQRFCDTFTGTRWDALATRGARKQRPLWASTSTKNPAYPDTLYVDALIGPDTVNTLPDATLEAFMDHGTVARTVDNEVAKAYEDLERLIAVGVDLNDVSRVLEEEGVTAFIKSFDELLTSLAEKTRNL